jgi:hypothetical protein
VSCFLMERCIAIRRGLFLALYSPARSGTPEEFARRPSKILTALIVKGIALDVPLWGELRSP